MRRSILACLCVLALTVPAAQAKPRASWAAPQIAQVTKAGLLGGKPATSRPDDALTGAELEELVAGLVPEALPEPPAAAVTMAGLDARLVRALGLKDTAYRFSRAVRAAGLAPPARFGTETVARLLGLRTNHPAGSDALERRPHEPASRAEAAFSAARILGLGVWELDSVRRAAADFALDPMTPWQQRLLRQAVALIGWPYVWGGETAAEGGYDCSGFVWAVYKRRHADAPGLGDVLRGRTTYQMSGEVPKAQRIAFDSIQPADVLFFGAKGPKSKPAQVDHMGLALGGGWMIHSSRYGVALVRLDGWWLERFAWARRPLAEAAIEPGV